MGAGIAHAFLLAGCRVRLVESSASLAEGARARVAEAVARSVERGALADSGPALSRLDVGVGVGHLEGCSLVVEAVPEDAALKRELLAAAEGVVDAACVLASNTSSLSISLLASALSRPDRFLGLHFFNPVPASELVEVVVGEATGAGIVPVAVSGVEALGRAAVVVKDSPGFASSRLGVALGLEAIRMVEEGVAAPSDIDTAMVLGYKHPMGPLRLTDLVGLDVRLAIAEYLAARLGPRFEPPALMREMVERGELGKKSGRGFYDW
jgi:3-hydroxybutyryl-CoA dehydrogenase